MGLELRLRDIPPETMAALDAAAQAAGVSVDAFVLARLMRAADDPRP